MRFHFESQVQFQFCVLVKTRNCLSADFAIHQSVADDDDNCLDDDDDDVECGLLAEVICCLTGALLLGLYQRGPRYLSTWGA